MNLSTSELFRYYHFVYTAYWDEGIVVAFVKSRKLTIFKNIGNDMWRECMSATLGEKIKFDVRDVSEAAALLIHEFRKPLY